MNLSVPAASGDIIIRVDGHSLPPPDLVAVLVNRVSMLLAFRLFTAGGKAHHPVPIALATHWALPSLLGCLVLDWATTAARSSAPLRPVSIPCHMGIRALHVGDRWAGGSMKLSWPARIATSCCKYGSRAGGHDSTAGSRHHLLRGVYCGRNLVKRTEVRVLDRIHAAQAPEERSSPDDCTRCSARWACRCTPRKTSSSHVWAGIVRNPSVRAGMPPRGERWLQPHRGSA